MARFVIVPTHKRGKTTVKKHVRRLKNKTAQPTGSKKKPGSGSEASDNIKKARSNKQDSQQFFAGNKDRGKLHNSIENEILSEGAVKNKKLFMTTGAPANGKSTLLNSSETGIPKKGIIEIDSDRIKGKLPEYNELIKNKDIGAASFVHEESSALSKRVLSKSLDQGNQTLLDGVGDGGYEKLKGKIDGYRKNGHSINGEGVTLDTELSVKIARARAKKTGRYVPISYVRAMNREVSRIVPKALKDGLYDTFKLYDTNIEGKPRKILEYKNGKTTISNKKLWADFLKKGGSRNTKQWLDYFD